MPRISEAVKEEHRRIEQAYRSTLTSTTVEDKLLWRNELAHELARHCVSEERVLLPAYQNRLPDGQMRAERNEADRASLQQKTRRLRAIPVDDESFESELKALWVDFSAHVRDTDCRDAVRLEECLSTTESEDLAAQFRAAMGLAPARSKIPAASAPPSKLVMEFLTIP